MIFRDNPLGNPERALGGFTSRPSLTRLFAPAGRHPCFAHLTRSARFGGQTHGLECIPHFSGLSIVVPGRVRYHLPPAFACRARYAGGNPATVTDLPFHSPLSWATAALHPTVGGLTQWVGPPSPLPLPPTAQGGPGAAQALLGTSRIPLGKNRSLQLNYSLPNNLTFDVQSLDNQPCAYRKHPIPKTVAYPIGIITKELH